MNSRRAFLTAIAAPAFLRGRYRLFAQSATEYSARAIGLIERTPVVDLLNQFLFPDYTQKPSLIERWLRQPGAFTEADYRKYRDSGIRVFALGEGAGDFERTLQLFAEWNGFIAAYPDWLLRIGSPADFERARRTRKIGIMLTLQDSAHFRTPDDVDLFFGLGQRLSQLTYNFNNRIGSGFLENRDGGLSVFGQAIMRRMERVGMAVDASHCGDQTTMDALTGATRPVVFTHASCRALVPGRPRAKTDEAIRGMARTGGVIGIPLLRFMIRDREPVTIEHVLDHFDHARRLVGPQYLAVGSDMDLFGNGSPVGGGFQPEKQPNFERYGFHVDRTGHVGIDGLDHPRRMYDLADGLIRRGYPDADIEGILGRNAERVLGGIWSAASEGKRL